MGCCTDIRQTRPYSGALSFLKNYVYNLPGISLFAKVIKHVLLQSINFSELGSKLCLVDLPGYGFAYAKEEVKEAWEELVST